MKRTIILLIAFSLVFSMSKANDGKYIEAMQKNIKSVYEAKDISLLQQAVNGFERIASVEKAKWEPLYYAAFGNLMMSNFEKDLTKRDAYLDKALESILNAKKINNSEAEIIALEGFVYMMKISVDPQSRGMVYAPQAMQAFSKALEISPENPRALALMAQMQYGSAQFFSSPVTEACALNLKAAESMTTYKSDNVLAPVWGQGMIESLKEKCK
jgi:tetratricopeptide (TPR) repeat protein